MRLLCSLILVFGVVSSQAELVCLGWGLVSPIVGVICHFKRKAFESAQSTVAADVEAVKGSSINAVEDAVQSVKALVKFDLTHNPAYIAYDFLSTTRQDGLAAGGQTVAQAAKDFGDVTVGFGKESYNQVEQLEEIAKIVTPMQAFPVAVWNDVSLCIIKGAAYLAKQSTLTSRKRATELSKNDAVTMAQNCFLPTKPYLSNVTGSTTAAPIDIRESC